MTDCPNCQRYKASASMWRNKAYEAIGKPLPWKPDELWVGLTDEERNNLWREVVGWGDPSHDDEDLMKAIEAKLKEKNT